jgi:putative protease
MASESDGKVIELLAPAGRMECLRAAIANGADAVYLGIGPFNARRRAENFTPDQLPELRDVTARCGVRLYAAMNTLLLPDELDAAAGLIEHLAEGGVDAVIVQDAGLAELATAMAPRLPLHASTQMTLSDPGGIELARRRWNLRRVILPRETSLDDLRAIAAETATAGAGGPGGERGGPVELEMFVHGAMCISYSGQCQASRHLGGRSGNRGQCAQPCRLTWDLLVNDRPRQLAGRHLLSPRDLCLLDRLGDLLAAGATSFKIEGRLKDPNYVAATVRVYRKALDAAIAGRGRPAVTQADRDLLQLGFSRGFTRGYLDASNPLGLVEASAPGNLGLRVGEVDQRRGRQIVVLPDSLQCRLSPGDGVAFGLPDSAGRRPGGSIYTVQSLGGGRIAITLGRDAAEALRLVEPGLPVWKTSDPKLQRELRQSYARLEPRRRTPIDIRFEAVVGQAPVMRCGDIEVRGAEPLQAAQRQPLTRDALVEQLARLGDTPLELGQVELVGPAGPAGGVEAMVPKSVINDLRRRLTERILEQMYPRRTIERPAALAEIRANWRSRDSTASSAPDGNTHPTTTAPIMAVLVRQATQVAPTIKALAGRATASPAGRVYLELSLADLPAAIVAVRAAGLQPALVCPRVISPHQRSYVESLLALDAEAMLVRNLGSLAMLRRRRPDWLAIGDASLSAVNEASALALSEMGLDSLTPGHDIDAAALAGLVADSPAGFWELPIRLHEVLFHTQYCLFSHHLGQGGPGGPCEKCPQPCRRHRLTLRDSAGRSFEVRRDAVGRCDIFSAQPQTCRLPPGLLGRLAATRIELLDEPADEIARLLAGGISEA